MSDRILPGFYGGINIIVSDHLPKEWVQVRFPRSKRRRIRRKWAKDRRNYAMRETVGLLMVGGQAYVSPRSFASIIRMVTP